MSQRSFVGFRFACAAGLLTAAQAFADAPLPPPDRVVACASSGAVCAESDPKSNVTRVVRQSDGALLWSVPGWHRWIFVSEDGRSMALGYSGMNLVPRNVDMNLDVMRFYSDGHLVRALRLSDLYDDRAQLPPTSSHLMWVEGITVNNANHLVLKLVTGKTMAFSMSTGQQLPASGNSN